MAVIDTKIPSAISKSDLGMGLQYQVIHRREYAWVSGLPSIDTSRHDNPHRQLFLAGSNIIKLRRGPWGVAGISPPLGLLSDRSPATRKINLWRAALRDFVGEALIEGNSESKKNSDVSIWDKGKAKLNTDQLTVSSLSPAGSQQPFRCSQGGSTSCRCNGGGIVAARKAATDTTSNTTRSSNLFFGSFVKTCARITNRKKTILYFAHFCKKISVWFSLVRRVYGKLARYRCNHGYLIQGQDELTCVNGSWAGTLPECIREYLPCRCLAGCVQKHSIVMPDVS